MHLIMQAIVDAIENRNLAFHRYIFHSSRTNRYIIQKWYHLWVIPTAHHTIQLNWKIKDQKVDLMITTKRYKVIMSGGSAAFIIDLNIVEWRGRPSIIEHPYKNIVCDFLNTRKRWYTSYQHEWRFITHSIPSRAIWLIFVFYPY